MADFFYTYKNLCLSKESLYKVGKTSEQLREEKAVELFFKKKELKNKEQKKVREIQGLTVRKMTDQDFALKNVSDTLVT